MRSPALRCFVDASGHYRSSLLTSTFSSPHNVANFSTSARLRIRGRAGLVRCDTSIASRAPESAQQRSYFATKSNVPFKLDLTSSPGEPSRWRRDPSKWIALLEPYLPPDLRHDSVCGEVQIFKPIHDVLGIMSKARESLYGGLDLLSYLGVCQKRWKAVIWLVKAMSSSYQHYTKLEEELGKLRAPQWKYDFLDLETLASAPIWADDIVKPLGSRIRLKDLKGQTVTLTDGRKIDVGREVIGQIWRSAASIILQAADCPPEDYTSKVIMSHALEILAHLHHIDAFPHSIYQYNPPADPSVPHQPPTLALLSSQMMAILSDTAWRAQEFENSSEKKWHKINGYYGEKRRQGSVADREFHVPELSHGIWLDLILWSCIEGGWISEAAWIVGLIDRRKNNPSLRWSVVRWDSIISQITPEMGWNTKLNLDYQRYGVQQLAGGIPSAGEGEKPCFIKIPPRTLSYEVITVLIDGLVSNSPNIKNREDSIRRTQESIGVCKSLLETDGQKSDPQIVDSAILRLLDLESSAITRTPELLEEVLRLSSKEVQAFLPSNLVSAPVDERTTSNSAISLGLIHQMLYCFARLDLVHGALRSFKMTQDVVDIYSQQRLRDFLVEGKLQPLFMVGPSSSEDANEYSKPETSEFGVQTPFAFRLPGHALVAFVDFIIRAELWELGKWLFYSNDVDGPTIPSILYSDSRFQPVFLRFATATADAQLLIRVTERLEAPLSQPILRALLHCQVAVGKWDSVQELLSYFRDEPGMQWDASDAMSLAAGILRMERSMPKSDRSSSEEVLLPFSILQKLISGEFNSTYSRALFPDLTQVRLMNQISRILRKIPGKLSTLKSQYFGGTERVCAPINVPVEAFNILMKCIVDCRGSIAGKELWDMWCQDVGPPPKSRKVRRIEDTELEQVIQPDLQTLRIILQHIIRSNINAEDMRTNAEDSSPKEKISISPETEAHRLPSISDIYMSAKVLGKVASLAQPEREIFQWGIIMYRKFGLTEEHLRAEVARHLLPWQLANKSAAMSQDPAVQDGARLAL